jgi:hypothetical protein
MGRRTHHPNGLEFHPARLRVLVLETTFLPLVVSSIVVLRVATASDGWSLDLLSGVIGCFALSVLASRRWEELASLLSRPADEPASNSDR